MTPAIAVDRLYLVCPCGSRLLLGRRDVEAWRPAPGEAERSELWLRTHSTCLDRAAKDLHG